MNKLKLLYFFLTFTLSLTFASLYSQIQSGPMLGYNTMKEVLVWVQTEKAQKVKMTWKNSNGISDSISVATSKNMAYTAKLIATDLEPGTKYNFSIYLDGSNKIAGSGNFTTQKLWQHREDPPDFSFATGSCAYTNDAKYDRPGKPYGQGNGIFEEIAKTESDFMLWLGDNIYLREPDWSSQSGIFYRYSHFKSMPEIQNLWSSMHHYAIWDDHDFGSNDADRSFINKDLTLKAFQLFWGNQNYGINDKGGITSQFSYNDADFFLLDNRYFRTPNKRKTGKRFILGSDQIEWLIDALVNSKATFKFVAIGGQFVSNAAVHENHATFAEERQKIIDLIDKEGIKNVIFLSGDRHKTELSKLKTESGISIYDFTCSPLSSTAYDTHDEDNTLRVEGTHVPTQNFGLLHLKGSFEERLLSISCFDAQGKLLWERLIPKE